MPKWLKIFAGILIFIVLFSLGTMIYQNFFGAEATTSTLEGNGETTVQTVEIAVETFQLLPSGALELFPGIPVLVSEDGINYTKVGETSVQMIDGIPSPVWFGQVNIGDWVTVDPPDNCVIWKVGAASWSGTYLISDEYAGTDLPLKFQLVCGEDIPTTTPEPTTPPSGPTETPSTPPTSTPPTEPTETPPTQPTPTPTKAGCNCPPPTEPLPSLPPPTEWDPTPTSTPIH